MQELTGKGILLLAMSWLAMPHAGAQAVPTAVKNVPLSFFAGGSGVYTGLLGGRNVSITAGADLRLRGVFGLEPSVEVRGTYPVANGSVVGQKNILGGLRVGRTFGSFTPYGDVLFGFGRLVYDPLRPNPAGTFAYAYSSSTVLSPGGGVDIDLTPSWGVKADFQLQRYSTPVTDPSHIYAKSATIGIVYHLFSGGGPR